MFPNAEIGRHSRIRRTIVDQDILLPERSEIGFDLETDRKLGHFVTESGIVIVHADSPGVELLRRHR